MKQFWEQLRPAERRWVIGIGCLVFVVLNYFFVWPRFGEWRATTQSMATANDKIHRYQAELAKQGDYEREIKKYEGGDGGAAVPAEDQFLSFATFYQGRALENGVQIQSESTRPTRTNEFFTEHQVTLDVVGDEKGMVGFLYSLGSSSSIMRVREMSLHAVEPNRYQLRANITIVASYQKNAPSRPAAPKPVPSHPAPPAVGPDFIPNAVRTTVYPLNRSNQPPPPSAAPPGTRSGPGPTNSRTNANSPTNKPGPPKR